MTADLPERLLPPREHYRAAVAAGVLRQDPAQQRAIERLHALHGELLSPPPAPPWWGRWLGRRRAPVRGLYLWGGPGRGKTWLMDAFFDSLPFAEKRRVHFHRFMLEIHAALDALPKTPDPLARVADQLAGRFRVLCVDEFHVTDIADAMLLAGLLEALFDRAVTLVATSNIAPRRLYHEGLQRARFEPAIDLIERHTEVLELDGGEDYRLGLLQDGGTCLVGKAAGAAHEWLAGQFAALAVTRPETGAVLRLAGRELRTVARADDVIWFSFGELCLQPRSARDYLELARECHTLLLEAVPRLSADLDEGARRFMHLVDALYDHGVKLVWTAEVAPHVLYGGRQLARPFRRTASRLSEMASEDYLARPHRPQA